MSFPLKPETDQEDVARLVSKYDLHAIPVVNKRMGIIGIITVDDIIDVIEEENTEDMLKLGGVNKEEDVDSSAWNRSICGCPGSLSIS